MVNTWGVHNDTLTHELIDQGFVSLGWDDLGDLRQIPDGRKGLKVALGAVTFEAKVQAIANWAGVLLRFRDQLAIGDALVAPYRPDSTINIGVITGEYEFLAS